MKPCSKCGQELMSGHIICGECVSASQLPLKYYIDQLAEEIVLEYQVPACALCIRGGYENQQSGLTCRNGVKQFLLRNIDDFTQRLEAEMQLHRECYSLLNSLRVSGETDMSVIRTRFATEFPQLTTYQQAAIISTWTDIR